MSVLISYETVHLCCHPQYLIPCPLLIACQGSQLYCQYEAESVNRSQMEVKQL
jgi:hypothetical protein